MRVAAQRRVPQRLLLAQRNPQRMDAFRGFFDVCGIDGDELDGDGGARRCARKLA